MKRTDPNLRTIQRLGGDAFKTWLGAMLVENPNGLGSELIESTSSTNNVRDADDVLRAAEMLRWIERTAFDPSISQQAFGGLQYAGGIGCASDDAKKHHASWFMWRIIDREAVEAFVGDKKPERTAYEFGDVVGYAPAFVAQIQGGARMRKATGTIVGWSTLKTDKGEVFPRVRWSDDPKWEPECVSPMYEGASCKNYDMKKNVCLTHDLVPYTARAVSPAAIRKLT